MALGNYALTTVAKAVAHIPGKVPSADQAAEGLIEDLVNAYSRAIANYTRREWKPTANGVARKFVVDRSGVLSLAPYDLRTITSITLNTDLPAADQTVLFAGDANREADYRLFPRALSSEATYWWIELGGARPVPDWATRAPYWGREVTILGDWGVGTVPADVELACKIAVANAYRNREGFQSGSLGERDFVEESESDTETVGQSLPRDARNLLIPYRREFVGIA